MAYISWSLVLDGRTHLVRLHHDARSTRRTIYIDGRQVEGKLLPGGRYTFPIGRHRCVLGIYLPFLGTTFVYELTVDGERVETKMDMATTLVRAAAPPGRPEEVLLRPASSTEAADSQQLLRSLEAGGSIGPRRNNTMTATTPIPAEPLSAEQTQQLVEQFHRDGYAPVRGVLTPEEVADLIQAADAIFADPEQKERHRHGFEFVIARLYEGPEIFQRLITRQPILGLVEAILGPGCSVVGLNVIRNPPSVAISRWHVDDLLEFPLPPEVARHDSRIRMPVLWLSVQVALTDIESIEYGPTQFVPGSHYAGHHPNDPDNPTFEGRTAEPVLCKAGDIYLQNHQCWHRGAPNLSDRTRYVLQIQYGTRWAIRRFTGIA